MFITKSKIHGKLKTIIGFTGKMQENQAELSQSLKGFLFRISVEHMSSYHQVCMVPSCNFTQNYYLNPELSFSLALDLSRSVALENKAGVIQQIFSFHFVEQNVRELGLMPPPCKLIGEWSWQIWAESNDSPQSTINWELARAVLCMIQQLNFPEEAGKYE